MWLGLRSAEVAVPSPKFQRWPEIRPVDWLVNWTVSGFRPTVGVPSKAATGAGGGVPLTTTKPIFVFVVGPPGPESVSFTVYDPAKSNVWVGFCSEENVPSPKSHDQPVTAPVDWSWKVTRSGDGP